MEQGLPQAEQKKIKNRPRVIIQPQKTRFHSLKGSFFFFTNLKGIVCLKLRFDLSVCWLEEEGATQLDVFGRDAR